MAECSGSLWLVLCAASAFNSAVTSGGKCSWIETQSDNGQLVQGFCGKQMLFFRDGRAQDDRKALPVDVIPQADVAYFATHHYANPRRHPLIFGTLPDAPSSHDAEGSRIPF